MEYNKIYRKLVKLLFIVIVLTASFQLISGCGNQNKLQEIESTGIISPNHFEGGDIQRIQAAVDKAAGTTGKVVIPANNSNGSGIWLLDSAILLPGNMTIILDNCTLQLSDQCRDNMFRSDNVGEGIRNPEWNHNISIIGIGDVILKGAANPRATGDSGKKLSLNPEQDIEKSGDWRITYGTDAGKEGRKQTGDWRNIMILMAYVDGWKLKNLNIENSHAWAVSHERVLNADISNIRFNNPRRISVDGDGKLIRNRDGINLRHGCKNFRINDISGKTEDDFIAMSILGLHAENQEGGTLNSTMVTSRTWRGQEDDTEGVYITNIVCESYTRAVAIRANDVASINNIYIDGIMFRGGYNALLVGGKGYGVDSRPGKINNIHAMNITGDGRSLIQIEEAISDCSFINGTYTGDGEQIILYNRIDKSETSNIIFHDLIQIPQ